MHFPWDLLAQEKKEKVVLISEPNLHIQVCSQGICLYATIFFPIPLNIFPSLLKLSALHLWFPFAIEKKAYVRWAVKLQDHEMM